MSRLHNYKTFHEINKLKDIVEKQHPHKDIMNGLFPLRNKKIGNLLYEIINIFEKSDKYTTPKDWFNSEKFDTFMEYFNRIISNKKIREIKSRTDKSSIVMPVEANVESIGDFTDVTIIKNRDIYKELTSIGLYQLDNIKYVSLKLLTSYYHRVHSPVDGTIQSIKLINNKQLFGTSFWIIELNSSFGIIYMLIIGHSFSFKLKQGDSVNKFDEIGNFNWGSKIMILYDVDSFSGDILLNNNTKYFVGDAIYYINKIITPTSLSLMPDTEYSTNYNAYIDSPVGGSMF